MKLKRNLLDSVTGSSIGGAIFGGLLAGPNGVVIGAMVSANHKREI